MNNEQAALIAAAIRGEGVGLASTFLSWLRDQRHDKTKIKLLGYANPPISYVEDDDRGVLGAEPPASAHIAGTCSGYTVTPEELAEHMYNTLMELIPDSLPVSWRNSGSEYRGIRVKAAARTLEKFFPHHVTCEHGTRFDESCTACGNVAS